MSWLSIILFVPVLVAGLDDFTIECDEGGCSASGSSDSPILIHGDILPDDPDAPRNAVLSPRQKWPNKVIPYVFHQNLTQAERDQIVKNMGAIQQQTCLKFVPRTDENYLLISKEDSGCYANVGYVPNTSGYTRLNLQNPGCFYDYIIQHELLHVTGLYHEQSRPDRDNFVTINWANIEKGKESNFRKLTTSEVTTHGVPYDYKSVMHYANYDFAINTKVQTISAKNNPNLRLGNTSGPTASDFLKVRRTYSC